MKKAAAIILSCILISSLLVPALAIDVNGQTVIFTIINNNLAPLKNDTMPVISGGMLYVPYSVITDNFGVASIHNSRDGLLILSSSKKTLFFDLINGGCYDRDNQAYAYSTMTRGGIIYVPAVFAASNFGLLCTYYPDSSVVRIKDITSSYSDAFLITTLASDFEKALSDYKTALKNEEPEMTPFTVYFSFSGKLGEGTEAVLDKLAEEGVKAAFFVTREDILANEALIRRIYVEGHTIGLITDGKISESAEKTLKELNEANSALDRVLNLKTHLVSIPDETVIEELTREHRDALRENGYRYWNCILTPGQVEEKRKSDDIVRKICDDFRFTAGTTVLGLGYEAQIPDALGEILKFLKEHGCTTALINEIDAPLNFYGDLW